jgi:hypothetical protein
MQLNKMTELSLRECGNTLEIGTIVDYAKREHAMTGSAGSQSFSPFRSGWDSVPKGILYKRLQKQPRHTRT